jgi:hypothetical protein
VIPVKALFCLPAILASATDLPEQTTLPHPLFQFSSTPRHYHDSTSPCLSHQANMPRIKGLTKDEVDFDATWAILSTAFAEIHGKNASQLSYEELFRKAYKLVLKKKADDLYDRVVHFEEAWLRDKVRVRIIGLVTPTILLGASGEATDAQANERRIAGERFMKALNDSFSDHQLCMGMITDVLMYMVSSQSSRL